MRDHRLVMAQRKQEQRKRLNLERYETASEASDDNEAAAAAAQRRQKQVLAVYDTGGVRTTVTAIAMHSDRFAAVHTLIACKEQLRVSLQSVVLRIYALAVLLTSSRGTEGPQLTGPAACYVILGPLQDLMQVPVWHSDEGGAAASNSDTEERDDSRNHAGPPAGGANGAAGAVKDAGSGRGSAAFPPCKAPAAPKVKLKSTAGMLGDH